MGVKGAFVAPHDTGNNRGIVPPRLALLELVNQALSHRLVFAEDEQTADVAVESMHEASFFHSPRMAEVDRNAFDQRISFVVIGRNGQRTGGLVNDD